MLENHCSTTALDTVKD